MSEAVLKIPSTWSKPYIRISFAIPPRRYTGTIRDFEPPPVNQGNKEKL